VEVQGNSYDALLFRTPPERVSLQVGSVCHLMVRLSVNTFHNTSRVQMVVQDYRMSGLKQLRILSALHTYESYRRGEPQPAAIWQAITPTREECITVYKAVPQRGIQLSALMLTLYMQNINACKMRICIDIFCELGLMVQDVCEGSVAHLPGKKHVDLQASEILKQLQAKGKEAMQHG
jgi:single-stranded-DNA-specific exonuclease